MDGMVTIGGLNLQGIDSNGCSWITDSVTGWDDGDTTLQITQKPRADGGWPTESFRAPQSVSGTSSIYGPSKAAVMASRDAFYAILATNPTVTIDEGAGPRSAVGYRQQATIPTWLNSRNLDLSWQLELPDPRKFGTPLTATTGLPSATGDLVVPFTVPFSIDSVITNGQVTLTNPGNARGKVVMVITGPCVGPVVTHVGSGQSLVFGTSLTLNSQQYLVVDMDAHTALAQGQASRASYITSRGWSSFDPGGNTWGFTAVSGTTATLQITATPAWL